MKSSKLVFFTVVTIFSLFPMLNAKKAEAGQSKVPFESIHDIDQEGKPLASPQCSDGWVVTSLSNKICKPYNGAEPDLDLDGDTNVNNTNTNNASSNSESSVVNSNDYSSVTISNNNDSYFGFSNGAKIPATSFNVNYINNDGRDIVQAGISIPLGVKKSTILKDVERNNVLAEAKFCLDATVNRISQNKINCDSFTYPEVELYPPVSSELEAIKAEMKEYLKNIKELKQTNEALQLRPTQMKHSPSPVKAAY